MARIRTIKPDFFTSEDIVGLSPLARLLYIATWCEADREGRLAWKPRTLKLRYFPGDDCSVDELADELLKARLIVVYGDGLAYIPTFKSHQHLNPREPESALPAPPAGSPKPTRAARVPHASATRAPRVSDTQGGREGKGLEGQDASDDALVDETNPESGFDKFWECWPQNKRKAAKDQCRRKWVSQACAPLADAICAAVEASKALPEWSKNDGEFIPAPLVWLNQRRWEAFTDSDAATGSLFEGAV